jgi:predicted lysophospholipase L1 biosynthesis ABC-type transport system permease subunit
VVSTWFITGLDSSAIYLPGTLESPAVRSLILRTHDSSPATLEAITRACVRAVPDQNCELMPMLGAVKLQRLPFLIASRVAAALGWIALAISCIGLYGLVSYLVVQKRREIGVRLALGAQPRRVTREMLSGAMRQILLGLLIGLPLAFALSHLAASFITTLRSFDLVSFVLVPLALALLSLCAAWLPARRSAAVPPTVALREE